MRRPLSIGITCYPTFGGSGVIATEIGLAMARRGHRIHVVSLDVPGRLNTFAENVFFHEVESMEYPVFGHSLYTLTLASKLVEVITYEQLDLLHAHYAVPHATSAYLAKQVMGPRAPKVITTLHGTDITLVGNDRSYLPITRFSVEQSDGITSPSHFLKRITHDKLNVATSTHIEVIPNFVDTERFKPAPSCEESKLAFCRGGRKVPAKGAKVLTHVSNFRPVKRIEDVVQAFHLVQQEIPAHLVLVGDGPERSKIENLVRRLGLETKVNFLGKLADFVEVLQRSDLFLLPSESEGFGLAALEALSCGVPVIGSNIGGIPEVVQHGTTGFLSSVGNFEEMAANALRLLKDEHMYRQFSVASRESVLRNWQLETQVSRYEDYYYQVLNIA